MKELIGFSMFIGGTLLFLIAMGVIFSDKTYTERGDK